MLSVSFRGSRLFAGALVAASVSFLSACAESNTSGDISGPATQAPPESPSYVTFTTSNQVNPGRVLVCINASAPAGTYTVTTTVTAVNGGGPYTLNSPVDLTAGHCAWVFTRTAPASSAMDPPSTVQIVVTSAPAGASVQDPMCVVQTGTVPSDCSEPDNTAAADVTLPVNYYHGAGVLFNFGGTISGGGDDDGTGGAGNPQSGCTYGKGYYKNHEEVVNALVTGTNVTFEGVVGSLPGDDVTLINSGGQLVVSSTGAALTEAQIDYWLELAPGQSELPPQMVTFIQKLIVAQLNVLNGALSTADATTKGDVKLAIAAAQAYIGTSGSSLTTTQRNALVEFLNAFNAGALGGTDACD